MAQLLLADRRIDLERRTLSRPGHEPEVLTTNEAELLRLLAHDPGKVFTKDELLRDVWGYQAAVGRAVENTVHRLRKKLEDDPTEPAFLKNVRGGGYYLEGVHREEAPAPASPEQAPRTNLRPARSTFIGRAAECARASEALQASRLVTLLGPGGAGKTTLAQALGRELLDSTPGGVWFCDLTEATTEEGVRSRLAVVAGLPPGADPAALGAGVALRGEALWIIDNLEQVMVAATGVLTQLLDLAPRARFLVTSRERLRTQGEVVVEVEPLSPDDALSLFLERARALAPRLGDAEIQAARELVPHLDGLPLAIELAASRVTAMAPRDMLARVSDRLSWLRSRDRDRPDRHATIQHTLDWTWDLLTPAEREALIGLSCFRGGFTLDAAEAVLSLPGDADPLDVLEQLRDKSLARVYAPDVSPDVPRLGLAGLVEEYARSKVADESTLASLRDRHAAHFAQLGAPASIARLNEHGGAALRRERSLEMENLAAALQWALGRGDAGLAAALAKACFEVAVHRARPAQFHAWASAVLALPDLKDPQRAEMLSYRAVVCWPLTGAQAARTDLEAALAITRSLGDRPTLGRLTGQLASILQLMGEVDLAGQAYEEVAALHRETQDARSEAMALCNLGNLRDWQGDGTAALRLLEQAIANLRGLGDRRLEGVVRANRGHVLLGMGALVEARADLEQGLAIHREVAASLSAAIALANLAEVDLAEGHTAAAQQKAEEALAEMTRIGALHAMGATHRGLAAIHLARGALGDARYHADRALSLLRPSGVQIEIASLSCTLAHLSLAEGDREAARAAHDEAHAIAVRLRVRPGSRLGRSIAAVRDALGAA